MTTFYSRRDGVAGARKVAAPPRVGLFFLNTIKKRLYALNETARQLLANGLPVAAADLERQPLTTPTGEAVVGDDMPLAKAWREGQSQEATFVLQAPNAPVLHVHWNASPLRGADDDIVGIAGSVTVGPPEPDWQEMAGLAHDLRTPLQAMRLLVPLLQESNLSAEARELAERIRSAAERSLSVGLDLLEWCRGPTQHSRRVSNGWFPLAPFLRVLVEEQQPGAETKDIRLHTDFSAARDFEVFTDHVRLGRLLSNLLSNAIRYTSAGRVQFTATWRSPSESKPPALVLKVLDTGTGISAEEQESIFLPFERGRAGKEGDSGGSGVGLSVVDRLVDELGLTLEVFSEYGHGSSFEVVLPENMLRRMES